jgi:hypothetical protein
MKKSASLRELLPQKSEIFQQKAPHSPNCDYNFGKKLKKSLPKH